MTWEIVAGILTLLGGFIWVGTVAWKHSAAVNKLECTVSALHEWVEKQADKRLRQPRAGRQDELPCGL